jgi:hypothetical protein
MINIHQNGLGAMDQIPMQLFFLLSGSILFFIMVVRAITYIGGSEELRTEYGWKKSDTNKFFLTLLILLYNILIMWFLAR